jgi:hypothetical protein
VIGASSYIRLPLQLGQNRISLFKSRAALLGKLRQQAQEAAAINYCTQRKVTVDELPIRMEIANQCR